jgi:hypothetical protein
MKIGEPTLKLSRATEGRDELKGRGDCSREESTAKLAHRTLVFGHQPACGCARPILARNCKSFGRPPTLSLSLCLSLGSAGWDPLPHDILTNRNADEPTNSSRPRGRRHLTPTPLHHTLPVCPLARLFTLRYLLSLPPVLDPAGREHPIDTERPPFPCLRVPSFSSLIKQHAYPPPIRNPLHQEGRSLPFFIPDP